MSNNAMSILDPFEDYQHIINDIRMRGGLKYIKAYSVGSPNNLPDAKKIVFGCIEGKITLSANTITNEYMEFYIQGVFAEIDVDCEKYDKWHYKRVREK